MTDAYICNAIRTPIGRYGGPPAGVRRDPPGAGPLAPLGPPQAQVNRGARRHAIFLTANQTGADKRNTARVAVPVAGKKGDTILFSVDEHPRPDTTLEALSKLKGIVKPGGTVTAGNASGVNDGACALLLASEAAVRQHGLTPKARVIAAAAAGVAPRVMGIGPVPATRKVLAKAKVALEKMNVIELNEAFASQALAVLRDLGIPDDAAHVNPNGGAIALGHPLGASGARLVTTAMYQLLRTKTQYALCTMCIGVGQGIAVILERV